MFLSSIRRTMTLLGCIILAILFNVKGFSQAGSLTGKVTEQPGKPLPGATVKIKGTNKETSTDDHGTFSFTNVPANGKLLISFVGFTTEEIKFTAGIDVNVTLKLSESIGDDIIVTGVFDKRTKMESSVAISTVNAKQIAQLAPTSAADLLRNVPGVYVNNGRGEIANTVYSRGISANSIDNASGYYYVSMQEDGLPVMNVNIGTDAYLRADITIDHLEAVRGGTASILGANAPGGIFNYISKTGGKTFKGEIRAKVGLEGDGKNPYYRTDLNFGGPMSKDGSLTYNIGGFYRVSDGARYPGYASNNGGQLKANILKTYKTGSLKIYGKILDDHNAQAEFIPSQGWDNPKIMAGLSTTDSYNLPAFSMQIPINTSGTTTFNSKDKNYSRDKTIGLNWRQELGSGWTFKNDGRYSAKKATGNVPAVVTPFATDDIVFYALPNLIQTGHLGTYTFTDKVNGQKLGTMGVFPNIINGQFAGFKFVPGTDNKFPGSNIQKNSLFFLPLFYSDVSINEFTDQFSFSKKLKNMTFNLGGFYSNSSVDRLGGQEDDGVGVGTLEDKPHLTDITLQGLDGKTYQITDPNGFMDLGRNGVSRSKATKNQLALFLGHNWSITPKLNLDWGVRYEGTKIKGTNTPTMRSPQAYDPTFGGADGNVLTVYDNSNGIALAPLAYDKTMNTVSFSAGLNYRISEEMVVYVRYSNGNKAPEIGNFFAANDQNLIDNLNTEAQNIQQLETAFKIKKNNLALTFTPFLSLLNHVPNLQFAFVDSNGNNYNPPTQYAKYRTYGIEFEGNYAFNKAFSLRAHATVQNSTAVNYTTWIANGKGSADDVLQDFSGNEADNNAKLMFGISPTYTSKKFFTSLTYNYLGSRQANIPNAFKMPGYSQFDLSVGYDVSKLISLQFNINNIFNTYGVLGWSGPGGFPAALNRQGFTKEYVAANPDAVYATQGSMPRAYFLTVNFRF